MPASNKLRPDNLTRLAVALVFGALAAGATGIIYSERDVLFHFDFARPAGRFQPEADLTLETAALAYAEAKAPGQACVEKWVGKDDKYVYLALGCARFEEKLGELRAVGGDPGYFATRLRYSGTEILGLERPSSRAYENGLRRLFPKEAADRMRGLSSSDFLRLGLARMAARGNTP